MNKEDIEIIRKNIIVPLKPLHNDVRLMIFVIVLGAEEKHNFLNIKKIHDRLKMHEIEIAYKNCVLHIKELEKVGLLQLKIQKYSQGQETIVKPTEKAHRIEKFLIKFEDKLGDKFDNNWKHLFHRRIIYTWRSNWSTWRKKSNKTGERSPGTL